MSLAIQTSPETSVLGAIGLAVFALAMWKFAGGAATPWDQLWGYAKRHLALEKAADGIREAQDAYGVLASKHIARLWAEARRRSTAENRQMRAIKRIASAIRIRTQEINSTIGEWLVVGGNLLRAYRSANLKARGNLAPPRHFNSLANIEAIQQALPDPQIAIDAASHAATIAEKNKLAVVATEHALLAMAKEGAAEFAAEIERARVRARGLQRPSNTTPLSLV